MNYLAKIFGLKNSGSEVMAIGIGPFVYKVHTAPQVTLIKEQERDEVARAVCRNIDRMLDLTGKYDINLKDIC